MSSLKVKLGARIQQIRKSKKLTQEQLAERIDLDIPNLSNIERGKRFVSANTLENIVKALDVTEKELFDFGYKGTKDELISEINNLLELSDIKELEYYYRFIKMHKEIV